MPCAPPSPLPWQLVTDVEISVSNSFSLLSKRCFPPVSGCCFLAVSVQSKWCELFFSPHRHHEVGSLESFLLWDMAVVLDLLPPHCRQGVLCFPCVLAQLDRPQWGVCKRCCLAAVAPLSLGKGTEFWWEPSGPLTPAIWQKPPWLNPLAS